MCKIECTQLYLGRKLTVPMRASSLSQAGPSRSRADAASPPADDGAEEEGVSEVGEVMSLPPVLGGRRDDAAEELPREGREGRPSNFTRRNAFGEDKLRQDFNLKPNQSKKDGV